MTATRLTRRNAARVLRRLRQVARDRERNGFDCVRAQYVLRRWRDRDTRGRRYLVSEVSDLIEAN